jgi:hypothetical protein
LAEGEIITLLLTPLPKGGSGQTETGRKKNAVDPIHRDSSDILHAALRLRKKGAKLTDTHSEPA